MFTREEETRLVVAAQHGDPDAAAQLVDAYTPNLRAEAWDKYPGEVPNSVQLRHEYEAELAAELWQAVQDFNPETDVRLWGQLRQAIGRAQDSIDSQALPLNVPPRTVRTFRQAHRIAEELRAGDPCESCGAYVSDAFAAITHALGHARMSLPTYTELLALLDSPSYADADEGRKDRWGRTVSAYVPEDPTRRAELAEVALDSMSDLQHYLAVRKYGFEKDPETGDYVPLPTEYETTGRPDAEVADWYNAQPAGEKPATRRGGDLLARRTVTDEIGEALATARQALDDYERGQL